MSDTNEPLKVPTIDSTPELLPPTSSSSIDKDELLVKIANMSRPEVELRLKELELAFSPKQKAVLDNYVELGNLTKSIQKAGFSLESMRHYSTAIRYNEGTEYVLLYKQIKDWEKELTREEVIANTRKILNEAIEAADFKIALEANKFLGAQLNMNGTGAITNGSAKENNNLTLNFLGGSSTKDIKKDLEQFSDILSAAKRPNKIIDITPDKKN